MSRRALFYIVLGVIALHLAGFFVLRHVKPLPRYKAGPTPIKRNFKSYERVEVDAATGEKTIYRDIEVSTKLTPRESLPKPTTPAPAATDASDSEAPEAPESRRVGE